MKIWISFTLLMLTGWVLVTAYSNLILKPWPQPPYNTEEM